MQAIGTIHGGKKAPLADPVDSPIRNTEREMKCEKEKIII